MSWYIPLAAKVSPDRLPLALLTALKRSLGIVIDEMSILSSAEEEAFLESLGSDAVRGEQERFARTVHDPLTELTATHCSVDGFEHADLIEQFGEPEGRMLKEILEPRRP
jgi:hypothetical protein